MNDSKFKCYVTYSDGLISYTLPLPTELVEVPIVIVSIQVKALEEHVTPKPIPLIILDIGLGTRVTLINNVTHASKVCKTPNTTPKDTPIIKKPES